MSEEDPSTGFQETDEEFEDDADYNESIEAYDDEGKPIAVKEEDDPTKNNNKATLATADTGDVTHTPIKKKEDHTDDAQLNAMFSSGKHVNGVYE